MNFEDFLKKQKNIYNKICLCYNKEKLFIGDFMREDYIFLSFEKNNTSMDEIKNIVHENPDISLFETNSFEANTIVELVIPCLAVLVPVFSLIIEKIFDIKTKKTLTVKYDNIEISAGSVEEIKEIYDEIINKKINGEKSEFR